MPLVGENKNQEKIKIKTLYTISMKKAIGNIISWYMCVFFFYRKIAKNCFLMPIIFRYTHICIVDKHQKKQLHIRSIIYKKEKRIIFSSLQCK